MSTISSFVIPVYLYNIMFGSSADRTIRASLSTEYTCEVVSTGYKGSIWFIFITDLAHGLRLLLRSWSFICL